MIKRSHSVLSVLACVACIAAALCPPTLHGAEPDPNVQDDQGRTPLMFGALLGSAKVVQSLLDDGAEVDAADNDGWTTLMYAAKNGYQDIVEILLKHGAEINAKSKQNATALIMAAAQGRHDVVRTLVAAGADLSPKDVHGRTALDYARRANDQKMIALLENPPQPPKPTPPKPLTPAGPPRVPMAPRVVGADGKKYATIGAALNAAEPGGRIVVPPGVYREGLVLEKHVEIVGEGPREKIVIESADADCVMMHADRAVIKGLTLRCVADEEDRFYAVDVPQGELLLEDCDISCKSLAGVGIHGESANGLIYHCWIHDGNGAGVFVFDDAKASLEECEIFGNAAAGVAVSTGGNPTVRKCRIHHGRDAGVYVYDNGRGTFQQCQIYRNEEDEVSLESGGKATFRECRIARHEDTPEKLLSIDTVDTNLGDDDDPVDPRLKQIILTFAQPMDTESWQLGKAEEESGQFPELVGDQPAFFSDERTFVLNVGLRPEAEYAFELNGEENWGFRSADGVPLEPTIIYFETGEAATDSPPPAAADQKQQQALARIKQLGGKIKVDPNRPGSPVVEIDLDLTQTTDDDLAHVEAFPELQTLLLAGTKVTNDGMVHLRHLSELRRLDVTLTEVRDLGFMHLLSLKKLEQLYAAKTVTTGFGVQMLARIPNLRTLCLDGTAAGIGPGLEPLQGMRSLQTLSLEDVELDSDDLACLRHIPNLKLLILAKTNITDDDLAYLKDLPELLGLSLEETDVTDAGLEQLGGLSKLKDLRLKGTKVTAAGIRQLQKKLPNAEISTGE